MKISTNIGYFSLISFTILTWILLATIFLKSNHNLVNNKSESALPECNFAMTNDKLPTSFVEFGHSPQKIKYHIPKFMLELYEKNKIRDGNNNSRPDVVKSVIPTHAGPSQTNYEILGEISDNHLLIFNLPTSSREEQFVSAELKILTLIQVESNAIIGVERKLKLSVYDDFSKKFSHLEEIHVYHSNNTWLSFNLTQPVTKILQKSEEIRVLKIVITISDFLPYYPESSNFKLSLMPISANFDHDYPVLLLSYSSIDKYENKEDILDNEVRKKRSIEEDYEEESNNVWDDEILKKIQLKKMKKSKNSCRRRPLYINFSEIEYDLWIVQPPGYEAYQCQGKCFYPVADHLNPTKHAIVQALLHSVAPSKATRSCCVPTLLDSISILYIDGKGVLTYRYAYKDMVVVECGCR